MAEVRASRKTSAKRSAYASHLQRLAWTCGCYYVLVIPNASSDRDYPVHHIVFLNGYFSRRPVCLSKEYARLSLFVLLPACPRSFVRRWRARSHGVCLPACASTHEWLCGWVRSCVSFSSCQFSLGELVGWSVGGLVGHGQT
jgi:hypothetical protein